MHCGERGYGGGVTPTPYCADLVRPGFLRVAGEVDELAIERFRADLDRAKASGDRAVVDLTAVDFFPSLGVGVLGSLMREMHQADRELTIVAGDGSVAARVLSVCGISFVANQPD